MIIIIIALTTSYLLGCFVCFNRKRGFKNEGIYFKKNSRK